MQGSKGLHCPGTNVTAGRQGPSLLTKMNSSRESFRATPSEHLRYMLIACDMLSGRRVHPRLYWSQPVLCGVRRKPHPTIIPETVLLFRPSEGVDGLGNENVRSCSVQVLVTHTASCPAIKVEQATTVMTKVNEAIIA